MTKIILAALVVLALAAGTAAAATPSQYRAQAGAICKATSAKIDKLPEPASVKELGAYLRSALPYFQAQYTKLRKLTPAASQKALVAKALDAEKRQLAGIRSWVLELAAGGNPKKTYDKWDKRLTPISDAEDAAWTKLGVKPCADLA